MQVTAISVQNLGISYRKRLSLRRSEPHVVLSDVSFDLLKGETLGIIGRNGAGKSTLLRILAGILNPNIGKIDWQVQTVSLLSLNLGLDPNLSGVDNAVLSALLLGFNRKEAEQSLPEIVAFSELGKAAYEPVRTYSSGMNARLGFSIAIHLQPDVLLIDEILGVGDVEFQKKSSQALQQKINSDQTVVLVSHNAAQIEALCDRVVWIENGKAMAVGVTGEVLEQYEKCILKKC
ncbi:ABC transporter ATP-binding protein [Thiolapillus sp.]